MTFYYILFSGLIFLLLLYFMPIKIQIQTMRVNENDVIAMRIRTLYGLVNLKFEIPYLKFIMKNLKPAVEYQAEAESPKTSRFFKKLSKKFTWTEMKKWYRILKNLDWYYIEAAKKMIKKIKINNLLLKMRLGLDDAALTGMAYGAVWIVLGGVLSFLYNLLNINFKDVAVVPDFDNKVLSLELSCIITFKLGHIINAGMNILSYKLRGA